MSIFLETLVAKARTIKMTELQMRAQRLSFVYGNTHIENARITREMVEKADAKVAAEDETLNAGNDQRIAAGE